MSAIGWLLTLFRPPVPEKPAPWPPCERFYNDFSDAETVCAACGVESHMHEWRCEFDEVGAENERRARVACGEPAIPFEDEPCDGCGEKRTHRKHTNGGEP